MERAVLYELCISQRHIMLFLNSKLVFTVIQNCRQICFQINENLNVIFKDSFAVCLEDDT